MTTADIFYRLFPINDNASHEIDKTLVLLDGAVNCESTVIFRDSFFLNGITQPDVNFLFICAFI